MNGEKKKHKSKKLFLSIIFLILIVAATFYFLFKNYDPNEILASLSRMRYDSVACGVLLLFVYIVFGSLALKTVINSLGDKIGFFRALKYSCVDIYFSALTPAASGGQFFDSYYMKKDGIPIYKSTIIILLITVIYKIVLIAFALMGFIFYPSIYFGQNKAITVLAFVGLFINVFVILFCAFCMFSKRLAGLFGDKAITLLGKLRIFKNPKAKHDSFDNTLKKYGEAAKYLKTNKLLFLKTFGYVFVQRTAMFSISFFVYRGLGFNELSIFEIIALQAAISLCVDSIPSPGSAGVTEIAFLWLYGRAYPNEDIRATALLVTRGITYYLNVIVSGSVVLASHIKNIALRKEVK